MSSILFLDAFAGISGDMTVGALLALGVELDRLRAELAMLPVTGYALRAADRMVHGIRACKFDVDLAAANPAHTHTGHAHGEGHGHRAYADIRAMLAASTFERGSICICVVNPEMKKSRTVLPCVVTSRIELSSYW